MSLDERKKDTDPGQGQSPISPKQVVPKALASPLNEQIEEKEKEKKSSQLPDVSIKNLKPTPSESIDDDDAPTTPGLPAIRRTMGNHVPSAPKAPVSAESASATEALSEDNKQSAGSDSDTLEKSEVSLSASQKQAEPNDDKSYKGDGEAVVPPTPLLSEEETSSPEKIELRNKDEEEQEATRSSESGSENGAAKRTPNVVPARRPKVGNMVSTRQQRAVRALEKRQVRDGAKSQEKQSEKNTAAAQESPLEHRSNEEDITKQETVALASSPDVKSSEDKLPVPQEKISSPDKEDIAPARLVAEEEKKSKKKGGWSGPPTRPRSSEPAIENRPTEQLPVSQATTDSDVVSDRGEAVTQSREEISAAKTQHQIFAVVPEAEAPYPVVPLPGDARGRKARFARQHHRNVLRITRMRNRLVLRHKKQVRGQILISAFSILMALLIVFLALSGTGAYIGYQFYSDTQGRYSGRVLNLHELLPKDNLKVYDSKGVLLGQLADDGVHTSVKLKDVSPSLINATIAVEDKNFWNNPGVDLTRILQAALDNLKSGKVVEGGSTITQQLIKKLIVGDRVDNARKIEEIILTPQVNSTYSKQDIMEMYLNTIYYGAQAYGIDAAANIYFGLQDKPGKPASKQLDLAQSVMLAGLPQNGDYYNPWVHRERATERMQTVLALMVEEHYITNDQAKDALKEAKGKNFFKPSPNMSLRAPHFFYFLLDQLQTMTHMSRKQLSRSDMKVTTTLDLSLQDKIQKVMQDHVAELHEYSISNSAEVLIDQHTGAIISLLGSLDYNDNSIGGKFDVATQGWRQPGSSFKPYVYALALEDKGTSMAQAVNDVPTTFVIPGTDNYTPGNYDNKFHGPMTLRCALQNSLNIPAVRVLQQVGIDNAVNKAKEMGINYKGTPGLSLVLGGLSVHLLDHVSAFGAFGNNGVHVPYYAVQKIEYAQNGKVVNHQQSKGKQVFSSQTAYMMTDTLSDNTSRLPEFGNCNPLQLYSNPLYSCYAGDPGTIRPAAAKTGTTNDFKDNWTVGYTTDYVMGVWAGNNDNSAMSSGATGIVGAAPIWHDAMLLAETGKPVREFAVPDGLVKTTASIDGIRSTDWFYSGKVPGSYNSNINQSWDLQSLLQDPPQNNQNPPNDSKDKDKGKGKSYSPYCSGFSYSSSNPGVGGW
ncbi:transglycosylase domain-containing protein [Ktedonospora formicarum]|uniref:Penicillin-insensitive transglycosylase n=1 Tax=Ktedonospora formicarum TaxID=2778364 RepID=A0A8J3MRV9_9CHLR|nr:transglycosylase domain-containing protein [Ktedonospora formicarum]GHO44216.1 hypothetical protein KSX_23790 [Ktedonospora formicarum]